MSEMSAKAGQPFVLLEEQTRDEPFGWVFFYQSEAFLTSGEFRDQLLGNAPFVVLRDSGDVRVTGTAYPVEHYLDAIRREYRGS